MDLKEYREQKGLSQTELGNIAGISQVAVSQYEIGTRKPNLAISKKIADALEISLDDFFSLLNISK